MIVGRPLSEHTVDRHGLVLLGGFSTDGDNSAPRVDIFMPMPMESAPQFRIGLSLSYDSDSASIPDLSVQLYGAGIELLGAYDWRLPIATYSGDFVINVEGGPSVGRIWMKVDMFDMPGEWDSVTGVGLGVASSVQYRAHNGFIASVQPIGIGIPIWHSDPGANNPFTINSDVSWQGALMVGYQWR
ncbi:MAG TPA: hypothetical protein VFV99_15525 [Kofleriaceae bacterium]|nr:hypothetical protein [Kofleriaceae bacterium]